MQSMEFAAWIIDQAQFFPDRQGEFTQQVGCKKTQQQDKDDDHKVTRSMLRAKSDSGTQRRDVHFDEIAEAEHVEKQGDPAFAGK